MRGPGLAANVQGRDARRATKARSGSSTTTPSATSRASAGRGRRHSVNHHNPLAPSQPPAVRARRAAGQGCRRGLPARARQAAPLCGAGVASGQCLGMERDEAPATFGPVHVADELQTRAEWR